MLESDRPGASLMAASVTGDAYRHDRPAVCWAAIVAGALAMAAFSLILLTLGTGLGLSSLSPWPNHGAQAKTFGVAAVIWILVSQVMSSGLGGYLAGRLRHAWPGLDSDEAHFRDTAHGFLAWSLAALVTAVFLTSVVSGAGKAAASSVAVAGAGRADAATLDRGHALAAYGAWPMGYLIDGMLRPAAGAPATDAPAVAASAVQAGEQKLEIARIFLNSLPAHGDLSADDSQYVASIVAQRTGVSEAEARARVATTWSQLRDKIEALQLAARKAADEARKAAIHVTLWLFISLLVGAFTASLFATIGGRQREW